MANRLMGSGMTVRGFDCFWIEARRLELAHASLPGLGAYQSVSSPEEWARLLNAHHCSEAARPAQVGA
jgi:hypothetical protein